MWSEPKRLEKGGDIYRGHIVRTYKNTDVIDITYQVLAYSNRNLNDLKANFEFNQVKFMT